MKIKFWGTRGSIPTPGPSTLRFGGNTSCVEVTAAGQRVVFDMGTGARPLGLSLLKDQPLKLHVFLSHMHHDHNQGIPFFVPCFVPGNQLTFYGQKKKDQSVEQQLNTLFSFPYFPVPLKVMPSTRAYVDLSEGDLVDLGGGLTVRNRMLNHPDEVFGYRLECVEDGAKKVIAYCTDTEHYASAGVPDWKIIDLAKDADVFIYDAQYTDAEYPARIGWGHSTAAEGVKLAQQAGAKKMVLFHHDPMHDDAKVAAIEAECQALFPESSAAFEGLEIEI